MVNAFCDVSSVMMREMLTMMDLGALLADPVFYGIGVPGGDGKPVVVIPGLLGNDLYLPLVAKFSREPFNACATGFNIGTSSLEGCYDPHPGDMVRAGGIVQYFRERDDMRRVQANESYSDRLRRLGGSTLTRYQDTK